jgi:WD40 repeat protein/nucleoside phosphorylase
MPSEGINFSGERWRHELLLGREDVLSELSRRLEDMGRGGWLLVKGSPGRGKSALLAHYLARLESQGEQIPHHFLRRGVEDWGRPEVVSRSLAAQVELLYLGQSSSISRPEMTLPEVLQRVSAEVLTPRGQTLLLIIDGLDEAETDVEGQNPLPLFLPHALPPGVRILCASRPTTHLDWLEGRERLRCIDLDNERWLASNEEVVRRYWEHVAPGFEPPLEQPFIGEAMRRADGNVLYSVKLSQWLREQPPVRRRAELLPRGLEAFLADLWYRLPKEAQEIAFEGLGLLAAAREALPSSILSEVAGWKEGKIQDQFLRVTRPFLREDLEHWTGERAWSLFHESFRTFIAARLGREMLRRAHRKLAELLCKWPVDGAGDAFRSRYAVQHGVTHWLEADDWERAESLCRDVGHLEAKCRRAGVSALEEELLRVTRQAPENGQALTRALHRAVQDESHWLERAPEALASLLYNRLRSSGWTAPQITQLLRFPRGLPPLRLRHPVRMSRGETRTIIGHRGPVNACAMTADGQRVVSASDDKTLRIWDLRTGQLVAALEGHGSSVTACAVSGNGRRVISASRDWTLGVWDLETGRALARLKGHWSPVWACGLTADGRRAVSIAEDGILKVWDLETAQALSTLEGLDGWGKAFALTADGRRVVCGSREGTLGVWDLRTGTAMSTLEGHEGPITACAVTGDGRVVSASRDGTLRIWELRTGRCLAKLEGHEGPVTACAVTGNGRVISASEDGTLGLWDLDTGHALATLGGHGRLVTSCAVTADGKWLVSASADKTLKVWKLEEMGRAPASMEGRGASVTSCVVMADGQRAISAFENGVLQVWNLETGQSLSTLTGHEGPVTTCAVLTDGGQVISGSCDKTLRVWDSQTGRTVALLEGHADWVSACSVAEVGRRVVSASRDGTLKVWNLETGQSLTSLEGHRGWVTACAMTEDGRRVISGSRDRTLRLWDLETGCSVATLDAPGGLVTACAVMGDGKRGISASADGTLKLWNLETGRALATFEEHEGQVTACVVTRDGRYLVSASKDRTLKLWDLQTRQCLHTIYGVGAFTAISLRKDVLCAGDELGNTWVLDLAPWEVPSAATTSARTDLGIIIALQEELRVFQKLLPVRTTAERDSRTGQYDYVFEHPDTGARCVFTLLGDMGPESAALGTERLISRWAPRTIVMLGIAAGIHPDVKVGDVVVASQIDSYLDSAKAQPGIQPGSFEFSLGGSVYRGDHEFITHVRNLEFAVPDAFANWNRSCQEHLAKLLSEEARADLTRRRLIRTVPELLDVHLASGPVVGAAQEFSQWLRKSRDRNHKALDMESAGLMAAAFKRVEPGHTLVIRGISDYGDERKRDLDALGDGALRDYAMHNATALLWTLLEARMLPSHGG